MTMPRVMYNPLTMVSTVFWCKCDLNKWKTKHVFPLFLVLDGLEALCFSSWCGIRDIIKTSPPTIYVVFLINQNVPFQTPNINREPTFFPKWNREPIEKPFIQFPELWARAECPAKYGKLYENLEWMKKLVMLPEIRSLCIFYYLFMFFFEVVMVQQYRYPRTNKSLVQWQMILRCIMAMVKTKKSPRSPSDIDQESNRYLGKGQKMAGRSTKLVSWFPLIVHYFPMMFPWFSIDFPLMFP